MSERGVITKLELMLAPLLDYYKGELAKEISQKGKDIYSYERGIYQGYVNGLEVYKAHLDIAIRPENSCK